MKLSKIAALIDDLHALEHCQKLFDDINVDACPQIEMYKFASTTCKRTYQFLDRELNECVDDNVLSS